MFIIAKVKTYLKKSPAQASSLPDERKILCQPGADYGVQAYIYDPTSKHYRVELQSNSGTWYIWPDHWDCSWVEESNLIVTETQANAIYGRKITPEQLTDLNKTLVEFDITTNPRIRHFLSQTAHESGGLRWMVEIASGEAYEGRRDLGNIYPGDGRRFRGVGPIQLTGRANYQKFADYIGDKRVMEGWKYVSENYIFQPSGFWWANNSMNDLCDRGATVRQITRRVNGGQNGILDRERYHAKALKIFP